MAKITVGDFVRISTDKIKCAKIKKEKISNT
jgi:hypothetical protein